MISIWNINTEDIIFQFKAHNSTIWSLNLFDNERYLISAGSDDSIKIWDIYENYIELCSIDEHTNTVSRNDLLLCYFIQIIFY